MAKKETIVTIPAEMSPLQQRPPKKAKPKAAPKKAPKKTKKKD